MLKNSCLLLLLVVNTFLIQQNLFSIQSSKNEALEIALEKMILAFQQKNSSHIADTKGLFKRIYFEFRYRPFWKEQKDSIQNAISIISVLIHAPGILNENDLCKNLHYLQQFINKDYPFELLTNSMSTHAQNINYQLTLEQALRNFFFNIMCMKSTYFDSPHYTYLPFKNFFLCEGDTLHLSYHPQRKSRIEHLYYEFVEASDTNVTHNLIETTLDIPTKGLLNQDETRKTITKRIEFAIYNHLTLDTLYDEKTIHFQVRKCE